MKLTNVQIYNYANAYNEAFAEFNAYLPVKANFILQKNVSALAVAVEEIEKARIGIAQHYGVLNEEGTRYDIPQDKMADVNKELQELFEIEQDLDIKSLSIEAFGNVEFTPAQMQAIMFMIEEG